MPVAQTPASQLPPTPAGCADLVGQHGPLNLLAANEGDGPCPPGTPTTPAPPSVALSSYSADAQWGLRDVPNANPESGDPKLSLVADIMQHAQALFQEFGGPRQFLQHRFPDLAAQRMFANFLYEEYPPKDTLLYMTQAKAIAGSQSQASNPIRFAHAVALWVSNKADGNAPK